MRSKTHQELDFRTAEEYRRFMNQSCKRLEDMTPSQKINVRNNMALMGTPDHSYTKLVLKDSAHYK
jgi:hypothetical protein